MIAVKIREAMERYRWRTGQRLTYERLAERTGLAKGTLEAIASRPDYNTTLATLEKLCIALECSPGDLLELVPSSASTVGKPKRTKTTPRPRAKR
jgi:putative transcriptional regulator